MDAFRHDLFLRSVVRAVQRPIAVHVDAITVIIEITGMRLIDTRMHANVRWGERCRTKASACCAAICKVPPIDAETAGCYSHHNVTVNQPGWLLGLLFFLYSNVIFLVLIRSNRDLYCGERSGEPIWGEEWVVCRNEQPWEVIRNGRYAQHFIYCPAMSVNGILKIGRTCSLIHLF